MSSLFAARLGLSCTVQQWVRGGQQNVGGSCIATLPQAKSH